MTGLYLSRLTLDRGAAVRALAPLLLPAGEGARVGAVHRLVWSLFADTAERKRDFLWCEDERPDGTRLYYVLSKRPPDDQNRLFEVETRAFAPQLARGDRLAFRLRANATVAAKEGLPRDAPGARGKRLDAVMAHLRREGLGPGEYGGARQAAAEEAALSWMTRQGREHGFHLAEGELSAADGSFIQGPALTVEAYSVMRVPRLDDDKRRPLTFGVLDLSGEIVVDEPDALLTKMTAGFGRARAFGCGLMLIRRPRGEW